MSVAPNHRLYARRTPSPVDMPEAVTNGHTQTLSEAIEDVLSRFDRILSAMVPGISQTTHNQLSETVLYAFHRGMDFEAARPRVVVAEQNVSISRQLTPLASPGRLFRDRN